MKKAISITLNGQVFMIEEDALQALSMYFEAIKSHFGADGEEITSDIEADIAEKFKAKGGGTQRVITILDVQETIKVMGTVNQIEESDEAEIAPEKTTGKEKTETGSRTAKRLYRDKDNAILGGVCSGLAAYFSVDPIIIRLVFIALTIMNGVGIVIYLIMMLIVPQAKTSVQKLEMQGEPINLKNIDEMIKEKSELIKEQGRKAYDSLKGQKSAFYKLLTFPVVLVEALIGFTRSLFNGFLPIARVLIGLAILVLTIFSFVTLSFGTTILLFKTGSLPIQTDFPVAEIVNTKAYFVSIVTLFVACLIPLVVSMMLAVSILRKKNIFNWLIATVLLAVWVLSVIIVSIFGFDVYMQVQQVQEKNSQKNILENNSTIESLGNESLVGGDGK